MLKSGVVVLTAPSPGQLAESHGAYVKVDGRECLLRSVELFLNRDNVKQVLLVIDPERMDEAKQKFGAHLGFSGVKVVSGGPRWLDQIAAAQPSVIGEATHVIVHDAARPVVPFSDIDSLMEAAAQHEVVGLCTPVRTTLVETDEGGHPMAYHLPDRYVQLLTPQCFSVGKFAEMAKTKMELHASTVHLLKGSPFNMRVGHVGDAVLAKAFLGMLPKPKKSPLNNPFEEAQW
ncbi:MAG TPA: 2-C-methyl-D-erythritol 4-phosphate cytidylyltransferase [Tepidisphaeraceae bacterium]|nr:2-C-methyl-D-erythritol 4-phosphate cytidylyltransferase [Tepidisphaeraceae bacterium]